MALFMILQFLFDFVGVTACSAFRAALLDRITNHYDQRRIQGSEAQSTPEHHIAGLVQALLLDKTILVQSNSVDDITFHKN